jgi:hypothetical protein
MWLVALKTDSEAIVPQDPVPTIKSRVLEVVAMVQLSRIISRRWKTLRSPGIVSLNCPLPTAHSFGATEIQWGLNRAHPADPNKVCDGHLPRKVMKKRGRILGTD